MKRRIETYIATFPNGSTERIRAVSMKEALGISEALELPERFGEVTLEKEQLYEW